MEASTDKKLATRKASTVRHNRKKNMSGCCREGVVLKVVGWTINGGIEDFEGVVRYVTKWRKKGGNKDVFGNKIHKEGADRRTSTLSNSSAGLLSGLGWKAGAVAGPDNISLVGRSLMDCNSSVGVSSGLGWKAGAVVGPDTFSSARTIAGGLPSKLGRPGLISSAGLKSIGLPKQKFAVIDDTNSGVPVGPTDSCVWHIKLKTIEEDLNSINNYQQKWLLKRPT